MRRHAPRHHRIVAAALNTFAIELPSWGFADTGTRFGKYLQTGRGDDGRGEAR